jgi:branched-chain amino acid transport system substrate-binding protein
MEISMFNIDANCRLIAGSLVLASAAIAPAHAAETIKLGLSAPLSGAAANWGIGGEWLCKEAAREIAQKGGVKVNGKVYNFECVAYDNKYNAAEGTKVAQTLLNRDRVKFIAGSLGTAPVQALQSLTERQGVLLFTTAWGASIKGPKYPMTFTQMNTPIEISPPLIRYVKSAHPEVKTVVLLNPNDATGKDTETVARKTWSDVGVKVLSSDWYERGTTEFQPIAAKIAAMKPDVVDLAATPPADAGMIFKELKVLGWDGVKVAEVGTGADAILKTGGDAVDGTYMGAAIVFDSPSTTPRQRELNEGGRAATGESLNSVQIGFYDSVKALAAAMEKAQSVEPKAVAAVLPDLTFESFYGKSGFGGKAAYGSPQQILVPVIVTQLKDGKLVEVERIVPEELKQRN